MAKKIREQIKLNETNKKDCKVINSLCEEYKELERKYNDVKNDFELIKGKIKERLKVDADVFTNEFKIVMSIQPSKEDFKYDMEKILKTYPEIKDNPAFGEVKIKNEVQTLKSVEKL